MRADGYHKLESLFAFLDLADELSVEEGESLKLEIGGEFAEFVDPENNLFLQILDFFAAKFGVPKNLRIRIKKNIPVGAGLGGGSSDAASFMILLNNLFSLQLSKTDLQKISLNFGSDIAFFFEDQASIVKGRGEVIENFPAFKPIPILLINPRISLLTKEVFGELRGNFSSEIPTQDLLEKDPIFLIKNFPNDLEKPAIAKLPIITEILNELRNCGAEVAKMSGSGATCFALFASEEEFDEAEEKLKKTFPKFFVEKAKILSHV